MMTKSKNRLGGIQSFLSVLICYLMVQIVFVFIPIRATGGNAFDPLYRDEIDALYCGLPKPVVLLDLDHTCSMQSVTLDDDPCTRTEEMLLTLLGNDAKSSNGGDVTCNPNSGDSPLKVPSNGLLSTFDNYVDFAVYYFNGMCLRTWSHDSGNNMDFNGCTASPFGVNVKYGATLKGNVRNLENRTVSGQHNHGLKWRRQCNTPMTRSILASAKAIDSALANKEIPRCTNYSIIVLGDGRSTPEKQSSQSGPSATFSNGRTVRCDGSDVTNPSCVTKGIADPTNDVLSKWATNISTITTHGIGFDLTSGSRQVEASTAFSNMETVQTQNSAFSSTRAMSVLADEPVALYQAFTHMTLISLNNNIPLVPVSWANPILVTSDSKYNDNIIYEFVIGRPLVPGVWTGNIRKYCFKGGANCYLKTVGSSVNASRKDLWSNTTAKTIDTGGVGSILKSNLNSRNVFTWVNSSSYSVGKSSSGSTFSDTLKGSLFSNRPKSAINYLLGLNYMDSASPSWNRWPLGASFHSSGVLLKYKSGSYVVFGSSDGMLHFVNDADPKTHLGLIPYDLVAFLDEFFWQPTEVEFSGEGATDPYEITKPSKRVRYGVDSDVTLLHHDISPENSVIDTGEKAWLIFGLGRGGEAYYAMNVSSGIPTSPTKSNLPIVAMNYPRVATSSFAKSLASYHFGALKQTWASPTFSSINEGSRGNRDLALVGSGHDPYYDRDTKANGNDVMMPKEGEKGHIKGAPIYLSDVTTYSCSNSLSQDIVTGTTKQESKFCSGDFYDSRRSSNNGKKGNPYAGYLWYKDPEEHWKRNQTACGADPTESGFQSLKCSRTSANDCNCETCSSSYTCGCRWVYPKTGSAYQVGCTTCTNYWTCNCKSRTHTCDLFQYDYFYDEPQSGSDPDEDSSQGGTTKRFKLTISDAYAYKVDFSYFDIGSGDRVIITDEMGREVWKKDGHMTSNSTTDWFYADGFTLKLTTDGNNTDKHSQDYTRWGKGIKINDIHIKKKFDKSTISWDGLGPSIFVLDLGLANSVVPGSTSNSLNTTPSNEQVYMRFTKSCGSTSSKCEDSSRHTDLKYMNYPISAKVSVVEKMGSFSRAYVGDEGGQIWRVTYDQTKKNWRVKRVFKVNDFLSDISTTSVKKIMTPVEVGVGDCIGGGESYAIYFGTGDSQRPADDMSDVVGMFVDDFPIEDTTTSGSSTFPTPKTSSYKLSDLQEIKKISKPEFSSSSSYQGWKISDLKNQIPTKDTMGQPISSYGTPTSSKLLRGPRVIDKKVYFKIFDTFGDCKSGSTASSACGSGEANVRNKLIVREFCTGNESSFLDLGNKTSVGTDIMTHWDNGERSVFVDGYLLSTKNQKLQKLFIKK